ISFQVCPSSFSRTSLGLLHREPKNYGQDYAGQPSRNERLTPAKVFRDITRCWREDEARDRCSAGHDRNRERTPASAEHIGHHRWRRRHTPGLPGPLQKAQDNKLKNACDITREEGDKAPEAERDGDDIPPALQVGEASYWHPRERIKQNECQPRY